MHLKKNTYTFLGLYKIYCSPITGGLNHLPYLLSTSLSLSVIKDFSTNYMTARGLNRAYTLYIAKIT